MAPNPSTSSNLEQLALRGLKMESTVLTIAANQRRWGVGMGCTATDINSSIYTTRLVVITAGRLTAMCSCPQALNTQSHAIYHPTMLAPTIAAGWHSAAEYTSKQSPTLGRLVSQCYPDRLLQTTVTSWSLHFHPSTIFDTESYKLWPTNSILQRDLQS